MITDSAKRKRKSRALAAKKGYMPDIRLKNKIQSKEVRAEAAKYLQKKIDAKPFQKKLEQWEIEQ